MLSSLEDEETVPGVAEEVSAAADNELVKLVNKIIIDAHKMGVSDIHIEPYPGKSKNTNSFSQGRFINALY